MVALQSGFRRTITLAAISAVARGPAFLIPVLIAAVFGAGAGTDAYFIAYSAVLLLGGTLGQGLEQAVVPFAAREIHRSEGTARRYLDRAAGWSARVGGFAWFAFIPVLVALASPGLRRLILVYSICFTPLTLAWCFAAVFSGALVSQWRIGRATGSLLWRGLGALVAVAFVPLGGGLWGVALGLGVGEVCRAWWLRRSLFGESPAEAVASVPPLGGFARAALAQAGASGAIGAAPLVERLFAVSLGVGAASHLEYAMRLLSVPSVLFEGALVPLVLARWTHQLTTDGKPPGRRDVMRVVGKGVLLATGIAIPLSVFSPAVVHLVLGHGRFTGADEDAVAMVLRALSAAYVANMGAQLLERHYIATTRNRTLAVLSVFRATTRLLVMWFLLPSQGLLAFPIGFAVSDWLYLLALTGLMTKPAPAAMQVVGGQREGSLD